MAVGAQRSRSWSRRCAHVEGRAVVGCATESEHCGSWRVMARPEVRRQLPPVNRLWKVHMRLLALYEPICAPKPDDHEGTRCQISAPLVMASIPSNFCEDLEHAGYERMCSGTICGWYPSTLHLQSQSSVMCAGVLRCRSHLLKVEIRGSKFQILRLESNSACGTGCQTFSGKRLSGFDGKSWVSRDLSWGVLME